MKVFEVVNCEEREDGFNSRIMTEDELLEFVQDGVEDIQDVEEACSFLWEQGYKVYDIGISYFE